MKRTSFMGVGIAAQPAWVRITGFREWNFFWCCRVKWHYAWKAYHNWANPSDESRKFLQLHWNFNRSEWSHDHFKPLWLVESSA